MLLLLQLLRFVMCEQCAQLPVGCSKLFVVLCLAVEGAMQLLWLLLCGYVELGVWLLPSCTMLDVQVGACMF
jgi:hypothetical protein